MRPRIRRISIFATSILYGILIPNAILAGDFKEAKQKVPAGVKKIFHRTWSPRAFPLKLHLHEDGVVNNNATGNNSEPEQETPRRISNEEVKEALKAGLKKWAVVPTAKIGFELAEETTGTAKAACDFKNIVTWSDDDSFDGRGDERAARGLTFFYAGPEITILNDTNRLNVPCSAGESRASEITKVNLPHDIYPNGTCLKTGTILDADLVWNSRAFDFVAKLPDEENVLDIQSLATHEFGHMLGLTHTSLNVGSYTPTMTLNPFEADTTSQNRNLQRQIRSLEPDDIAAAGRAYPGPGFFPSDDDNAPFTTGAISGRVTMNGNGVEGVRVWLYSKIARGFTLKFETFTASVNDPELTAGDYLFAGIPPGPYLVCVQKWNNGYPNASYAEPSEAGYNWTVARQAENTANFQAECFDDFQTGENKLKDFFEHEDRMQAIIVERGEMTTNIDFSVEPRQNRQ